jgi:hypothetical protein
MTTPAMQAIPYEDEALTCADERTEGPQHPLSDRARNLAEPRHGAQVAASQRSNDVLAQS